MLSPFTATVHASLFKLNPKLQYSKVQNKILNVNKCTCCDYSSVKCVAHNCTTSLKVLYGNLSLFRLFNNNNDNNNNNNNNNNNIVAKKKAFAHKEGY